MPVKACCTTNPKGCMIGHKQYAKAVEDNARRIKEENEKYALRQ